MAGISSIEAPDDQTVVVTFERRTRRSSASPRAPYMGIVSAEMAQVNGATIDAEDAAEQWFLANSAGSGPFVLESYTEGDQLVLARNDDYWGEPSPFPSVTLKQVKDAAAQLQQLQQGDVDIAMQVSFDSVGQLEGAEGITTDVVDSFNFVYLALSPGSPGGEPLADPQVREAIKKAHRLRGDHRHARRRQRQAAGVADPQRVRGQRGPPAARSRTSRAPRRCSPRRASVISRSTRLPDDQRLRRRLRHDDGQGAAGPLGDRRQARTRAARVPAVGGADHRRGASRHRGLLRARLLRLEPVHPVLRDDRGLGVAGPLQRGHPGADRPGHAGPRGRRRRADAVLHRARSGDDQRPIILPLVNPGLVLAHASDVTGVRYSACCNLESSTWASTGCAVPRDDALHRAAARDRRCCCWASSPSPSSSPTSSPPTRWRRSSASARWRTRRSSRRRSSGWGLDSSIIQQYVIYVGNLFPGDLGTSFRHQATGGGRHPASPAGDRRAGHRALIVGVIGGIASGCPRPATEQGHRSHRAVLRARRLVGPGLLVGPDPAVHLLGPPGMAARPRPADSADGPPPDVTGFYTIDSLLAGDFKLAGSACATSSCRPSCSAGA